MKKIYILISFLLFSFYISAQCPTVDISRENWRILDFDTEETNGEGPDNGHAIHCIDGDTTTFWHSQWQNVSPTFPHFIAIDMGDTFDIVGITLTSRYDSPLNKPKGYEIYLSMDSATWDPIQARGDFIYDNINRSGALTEIHFGAIKARYFKIIFNSSYSSGNHTVISELYATALDGTTGCEATGQDNQILTFEDIPRQYADNPDIELQATTNTGLPVTFTVDAGPATIDGNILSFTGDGGTVIVTAHQEGDDDYYPVSVIQSIEVVNLDSIAPEITTGLSSDIPIRMPQLMPYRLYATGGTAEDEVLDIENITFEVDGELLESEGNNGHYVAWWTPTDYGEHTIIMTAISSNGMTAQVRKVCNVTQEIESQNVVTIDGEVINFDGTAASQWYYGTYTLPQSVGAYDRIIADFAVSCPNVPGGCDDWDRLAYVQIKNKKGEWIELFRYITPYGVACNHSIDVTDYASVLQGVVDFRVYIETWGTGGWKLDLILDYQAGTPEYTYSSIDQVWIGNYNFGDLADLQPVPVHHIDAPDNTEKATFRLVTTGHGWGQNNTGNAAEFYYAQHYLLVNGDRTFRQDMKVNCDPNPDGCTGQNGTWYYDRAGWCPGTIPAPYFYDLTPYIGTEFDFKYQFETTYVDQCHPHNPNCRDGVTCPNCNDGYNPYYRVSAYVIYKSNDPLGLVSVHEVKKIPDNKISISPNPSNGIFHIMLEKEMQNIVVEFYDIRGMSLKTYYFNTRQELNTYRFNLNQLATGVYFVKVYNKKSQYAGKVVIQ